MTVSNQSIIDVGHCVNIHWQFVQNDLQTCSFENQNFFPEMMGGGAGEIMRMTVDQ